MDDIKISDADRLGTRFGPAIEEQLTRLGPIVEEAKKDLKNVQTRIPGYPHPMEVIRRNIKAMVKEADIPETNIRAQITRLLMLLTEKGPSLGMPLSRKLGGGLYELRQLGGLNIRIFYTFHGRQIVVLDIFKKKSQKLRKSDLAKAHGRLTLLRHI